MKRDIFLLPATRYIYIRTHLRCNCGVPQFLSLCNVTVGFKATDRTFRRRPRLQHSLPDKSSKCPNLGERWSVGETGTFYGHNFDLGRYLYSRFQTVRNLKELKPNMLIEALVPDYRRNNGCAGEVD
ncbi:hypothetical protein WN944_028321 [Citrus x changshan-huyou]|uniref:Uncharacterized protein n=1 Tax=Citrus x changshan-huyou TaxID=2935761 RepID=A0AAP0LJL3_9ROSI